MQRKKRNHDKRLTMFLRMWWFDPRLAFEGNNSDKKLLALFEFKERNRSKTVPDMEVLTVHTDVLKQIWKPDLFFSNEKDAATHKIVTENALIRYLYCCDTVFDTYYHQECGKTAKYTHRFG